ncbi:nucleoside/nucleotide kinase family protein [Aliiroseovarius sp. S1339]|uniref:nucleoside/nucleotide kinase family protein n=1 Tax=Aliiroseovarius sp. S1339 TaxID=2936990 RepID=UPI0020BEBB2B|nr:nucleoside/nucleotide kinase family protein [Aliiroseovarius sp. S1339]MCK8464482.1 nucleoside/nucleotide kinase family protein [Aliiroseovarius sp. S1339]
MTIAELAEHVRAAPRKGTRRLVAVGGAPASGKSTLAEALADHLTNDGCPAKVVPMDGFHLHNQILVERDLLNRKGAPQTFDAQGFLHLITRLHDEPEVFFPLFDRDRDIAIAGAGLVDQDCNTVIVEGNYLLQDLPIWRDLRAHWDLALCLEVEEQVLHDRLVARWLKHGLSPKQAEVRAAENDLKNAQLVRQFQLPADIIVAS